MSFIHLMKAGTSVVYQLIVQIQTLAASPLIYSVSVEFVNLLYLLTVGWAQITDITVDLPPDVTVLPQTYTLHAIKSGYTQNYLRKVLLPLLLLWSTRQLPLSLSIGLHLIHLMLMDM